MTLPLGPQTAPLTALAAWDQNPRTISDERLDLLKHALTADPAMLQARPLIVTPDGVVVGGNQRLRAARELGWDSIPIFVAGLDETRRREWALRDNAPYGDWESEGLAALIKTHADEGSDIALLGFSDAEAEALMALAADPDALGGIDGGGDQDGLVDTPPVVVTKRGDLWRLGRHRVMCGDSRDPAVVGALLEEEIDALVSDPPYGIRYSPSQNDAGAWGPKTFVGNVVVQGDDEPFDPAPWLDYPAVVLFGANHYADRLPPSAAWLVWDKREGMVGDDFGDCEMAWTNLPGVARLFAHRWRGAIRASERGEPRLAPTQKPVALMEWVLERIEPCHAVLDPFLGSGSTLIACERTGRACYGLEIDPAYCDVIVARWEKLTGATAERIPATA